MDFNMTDEEKQMYHLETDFKSESYYDGQYLKHLESQLKHNGSLKEHQKKALYNIFLKSFKHSTYALQEVEAFIDGNRINRAECE